MDGNPPVTGPPDPGTSPRYEVRGHCHPYQASNAQESVSLDGHGRETEISEYVPHPYDHGR